MRRPLTTSGHLPLVTLDDLHETVKNTGLSELLMGRIQIIGHDKIMPQLHSVSARAADTRYTRTLVGGYIAIGKNVGAHCEACSKISSAYSNRLRIV